MNMRILKLVPLLAMLLTLSGCFDRLDMEEAAFSLVLGLDLDEQGNLLLYSSIPNFNKNAKKKTQEVVVKAPSPRAGRNKADIHTVGVFQPRKIQVIVISKHLLENKQEWFRYLDVFFRDGRNPLTTRVMVFDGRIQDLYKYLPKDKPILPLQLLGILESVYTRTESVKTTLQQLQRTMLDKGQTPAVPQLMLNSELSLSRTALLDHEGRYVTSLTNSETMLLRILQKNAKKMSFTFPMPKEIPEGQGASNTISFSVEKMKTQIEVSHTNRFRFDISVRMGFNLTEILFPLDVVAAKKKLEAACSSEIQKQLQALVAKLQKNQVDPVGFGVYARAYEYAAFKNVQDQWGQAFSQADVHVNVSVTLADTGAIE